MKQIGKIIAKNRKESGINQREFAEALSKYGIQIKKNAISSWEADQSQPNAFQFLALCDLLGIKDIYSEFIGPNSMDPFCNLNDEGKAKALDYIRLLEKSGDYEKEATNIVVFPSTREMRIYNLPVSAGTGSFLDGDDYELFTSENVPQQADFGVHVSGDSMEPKFQDKQLIWIQQSDTLENGEIGIFYLDGNAYVKKLRINKKGTFLVSLNKKYDPIPVNEDSSFKIFGRVVD